MADIGTTLPKDTSNRYFAGVQKKMAAGRQIGSTDYASQFVEGPDAHDAAATGQPLQVGSVAETTAPTAVSDGDAVRAWLDQYGRIVFVPKHTDGTALMDANGIQVQVTANNGIGSLTETAPASDTASSGLNGRLQRIAQRLTSLIALLPTSLGAGGGLKVDGSGTPLPVSTADGGQVTIGAKADAKSTATDTTAVSAMSVWKQISASVQAIATSVAGTLTVATHAVTQSGTWTVQPGNTANTTAWKVDGSAVTQPVSAASLPLPTGAATAAKQPALGTAGTASSDVISVQGIASGTPLNLISGQNGVAGNQGGVSATTQRVVLANDVGLPASSNHIGQVGGETVYSTVTPTLSVAGAYASGDYIGQSATPQSFAGAVRSAGFKATVKSLTIVDKVVTAPVALELWLFSATFTAPTDNAAWTVSDADALNCVAVIPITTDKWYLGTVNKVYSDDTISKVVTCASTTLFYALVARGATPTWASGDLQLSLGLLLD